MGIQVSDGRAYLATWYDFLIILDVSTPTNVKWVSMLKNWYFITWGIAVNGSYAFLAQHAAGLRAVDISDPEHPVEIAAIRDHYRGVCYDVVVQGNYIFIADGWDGLEIYELKEIPTSIAPLLLAIIIPLAGGIMVMIIVLLSLKKKLNV